jgi:hypothetical protein
MKISGLRLAGAAVIAVSVLMVFLIIWFLDTVSNMSQESCTCGDECGMVHLKLPAKVYVGLFGVCMLFLIGITLFVKGDALSDGEAGEQAWPKTLNFLAGDEKTVYGLIVDSGGALFQSEIVEKTGLSKVKVTRTLDKLESRQLLERRRRGLTNIVVLRR